MPINLAPVYLDDLRVQLQGDPKPRVSKIVAAGGKSADGDLVVVRLQSQTDEQGSPVELEEVIDRSQQTGPVYLRCLPGGGTEADFIGDRLPSGPGVTGKQGSQFGAATTGLAGQGAEDSPGKVPADKQAKSDVGDARGRQQGQRPTRSREGDGPAGEAAD